MDLTQEAFASRLGVSTRTIQNWEGGKIIPKTKIAVLKNLASMFPKESFTMFDATDSPGAGYGTEVQGISSADLKTIMEEMNNQRKDYLEQIEKKDKIIEELIGIIKTKLL